MTTELTDAERDAIKAELAVCQNTMKRNPPSGRVWQAAHEEYERLLKILMGWGDDQLFAAGCDQR